MPATCKICNNVYKRYEYAEAHVRTFHGIGSPKAHVAETTGFCIYADCNFMTVRTWNFIKHIRDIHLKVVCLFIISYILETCKLRFEFEVILL